MIPVKSADEYEGYDSPEAAITAAKKNSAQKSKRDEMAFAGHTFVDLWRTADHHWFLEFSGGLWLRVFADRTVFGGVGWAVETGRPAAWPVSGPVVLQWAADRVSSVDAAALAAKRRGAPFWQFWLNDMGFHVYLRGQLILCFSPARRLDTGEMILHVWEDD